MHSAHKLLNRLPDRWTIEIASARCLADNESLFVDQIGGGNSQDTKNIDRLAMLVQQHRKGRFGINLAHVGKYVVLTLPLVQRQNGEGLILERLVELLNRGHLLPAGRAPGCPEIDQHHLATVISELVNFPIEIRQSEVRSPAGRLDSCQSMILHGRSGPSRCDTSRQCSGTDID